MTNSSNDLTLALLATLESRAKKKGQKSLVKQVAHRLRKAGADADLVKDVEALNAKPAPEKAKTPVGKPAAKAKAKPQAGQSLPA